MRVLGAVVLAQSLFVAGGQSQLGFGGRIGTKSIRDHSFWGETLFFEQLSQEFHGSRSIAPALDQEVKDLALVVNRSPQPEVPTRDRDHHLIKMPPRRRLRSSIAQFPGELRSELRHPSSNSFVGDVEPALGEQVLDVSEAEREAKVEPDSVPDHRRRILVAGIGDAPFYRLNRIVSGFV